MDYKKIGKSILSLIVVSVFLVAFTGCTEIIKDGDASKKINPVVGECATDSVNSGNTAWPAENPKITLLGAIDNDSQCIDGKTTVVTERVAYPNAVAGDSARGKVYVSDRYGVKEIDEATKSVKFLGDAKDARGLAVASNGDVYVADAATKTIQVYSNGALSATIGAGELSNPHGLALDEANQRIYVVDVAVSKVIGFGLNGEKEVELTGLKVPAGAAVNSKGNIYVTQFDGPHVQVFNPAGDKLFDFAPHGKQSGTLQRPKGIAIDSDDNVYVADMAFNNVQVFDAQGNALTYIGPGQFLLPALVSIDNNDTIWVAEKGAQRVQIFQYNGN
ncbi:MAG: hypothetical protein OEZ22_02085 [Spirochaetia bacterium]|nr:hypothetical protein [Spirochaetia bacterium]